MVHMTVSVLFCFFFSSRRRHTRYIGDWSSDVCSSDLGALRGGLHALARHPERDEYLVGGSDGIPQAYRIERKVQRRIGDNRSEERRVGKECRSRGAAGQ